MQNNDSDESNIVKLINSDKNAQIIITYDYPTKKIREIILDKNQEISVYGISFILKDDIIVASRGKEMKKFQIPGSYYINISPDESWDIVKPFSPFEGKNHPKRQE